MRHKRLIIVVFSLCIALTFTGCKSNGETLDDLYHSNMAQAETDG